MTLLLDTHFLLWIVAQSRRLSPYPWLANYRPWGVSPVTFLEIQYLAESGRAKIDNPGFTKSVQNDPRFVCDEPPMMPLVEKALGLGWTRDPFDRLLAAHSLLRRVPLCTLDRRLREHHSMIAAEIEG